MNLRRLAFTGMLLTACVEHPPRGSTSDGRQQPPEDGTVDASPPVTRVARAGDPDPQAVQQALAAALAIPVVMLGRQPLHTEGPPYVDFVTFKAKGQDWCSSHLPLGDRITCVEDEDVDTVEEGAIPWSMVEILGFALVAFETPAKPYVSASRFVGSARLIPSIATEPRGQVDSSRARHPSLTRIALDEISAQDVDGDQQEEVVVRVSHGSFDTFEGGVHELFWHKRLMVFRADLSLQADGYVHQYWHDGSPAVTMDDHRLHETVVFEKSEIVLEWCEVASFEPCALDVVCPGPTERIVIAYDPAIDAFPRAQTVRLRPPIEGVMTLEGDECVGPKDADQDGANDRGPI
jgi:hypothetical protein